MSDEFFRVLGLSLMADYFNVSFLSENGRGYDLNFLCKKSIARNFANVFQTGLVRNLECGNLHELKKLMIERRAIGIERYQTVLQAFNGRKAIDDLLAEQLDSLAYSEQVSIETPELTEEMLKWQRITINAIQKLIEFKSKKEEK